MTRPVKSWREAMAALDDIQKYPFDPKKHGQMLLEGLARYETPPTTPLFERIRGGGLLCFGGKCTVSSSGFTSTGKVCVALECRTNDDCDNGLTCAAGHCVCDADADCGGGKCSSGKCIQCSTDTDCTGNNRVCNNGACIAKCVDSFDCQNFYACNAGHCTFSGCTKDRECQLVVRDVRAKCDVGTKACYLACAADVECNDSLVSGDFGQICNKGRCENVGCESTTDCELFFTAGKFGECQARTP